jgi:hypothetical protein
MNIGQPMAAKCLEGYNCTIFAYGQTGSGKTFTMQGAGLDASSYGECEARGLQPRVFEYLFHKIREHCMDEEVQYLVKCQYFEIYNENIMDLLSPASGNLQIRVDLKQGVFIDGITEEIVTCSEEAIEILKRGANNRHIGATNMNLESSRSHSVFSMTLESKSIQEGMSNIKQSKFHFVDLAGSESQKQTGATGDRLKEASNINKSLTVLGSVINSLVEIAEGKKVFIRYRDSKLTHLLKDSLGGNSKTCIVANISPSSVSFSETLSTLKFAARAKMIKNRASVNEEASGNIESLKTEISRLKVELECSRQIITS